MVSFLIIEIAIGSENKGKKAWIIYNFYGRRNYYSGLKAGLDLRRKQMLLLGKKLGKTKANSRRKT